MRDNFTTTLDTDLKVKLKILANFEHCDANDIIERVMIPYVEQHTLFNDNSEVPLMKLSNFISALTPNTIIHIEKNLPQTEKEEYTVVFEGSCEGQKFNLLCSEYSLWNVKHIEIATAKNPKLAPCINVQIAIK